MSDQSIAQKESVRLTVPARAEYAKIARMTAATLVANMDWSYDEVDDVRMAVEEAFIYAVGTEPTSGEIIFDFLVEESMLEVDVTLGPEADRRVEEIEQHMMYASFILESVCDSHDLVSTADGRRVLRLYKRSGGMDAA